MDRTCSRSIGLVQLMLFSPDIFSTGKGLSADGDRATFNRARGPVNSAFHTYTSPSKTKRGS